jgi:methionyl-tRNA formyltransferase
MTGLKLAFMGTPDFSVASLEALIEAGHDVVAVYTQPPRPAGRGKKPRPSPVQAAAEAHGIPVYTPKSLKSQEEQDRFRALGLDAAVVVAYGLILPKAILDAPRLGCLNVHASLLPRWRGAAPIQRAILAGDAQTGVAIMKMDEGLDTGPVLAEEATAITADDTAGSLHDRLMGMGAALLVPTLAAYAEGHLTPHSQPDDGVTYAAKIDKAEARIDWSRGAGEIHRLIRAMAPFPGAWCMVGEERIKILAASVVDRSHADHPPGTVIDDPVVVLCGDGGTLRLDRLQRAGKGVMTADDFLRGFPLPIGATVE